MSNSLALSDKSFSPLGTKIQTLGKLSKKGSNPAIAVHSPFIASVNSSSDEVLVFILITHDNIGELYPLSEVHSRKNMSSKIISYTPRFLSFINIWPCFYLILTLKFKNNYLCLTSLTMTISPTCSLSYRRKNR